VPDVTRQLERLRSANRNTRYGACEELRVAATIPEEAIAALRHACNDLDPSVSDAATRALSVHTPSTTTEAATSADTPTSPSLESEDAGRLLRNLALASTLTIGIPLVSILGMSALSGEGLTEALFGLQYTLVAPLGYVGDTSTTIACCLDSALLLSPLPATVLLLKGRKSLGIIVGVASGIAICLAIVLWAAFVFSH